MTSVITSISSLLPSVWEKWLGVFLRAATACVGVGVAGGLSLLIWQAAHSDGLKVEPFSVPPQMAERGLTGEVVATRVIDRLSELQSQTNTARPARSWHKYLGRQGDQDGDLRRPASRWRSWIPGCARRWGHETALTGEVVSAQGASPWTAGGRRDRGGQRQETACEADIDALTGKLAEEIYRITQPYRYATWLLRHENRSCRRTADLRAILR